MKKDYSELLRRLECGPMDGTTRDAAFMAIRELVAERDARADLAASDKCSGSFEADAEKIDGIMRSQFSAARQETFRCYLSSAYARGKAEEREACAKWAEWYLVGDGEIWDRAVKQIAAAIRARSRIEDEASPSYDAQADMKSAYNEWAADAAKDSRPLSYPVPAPNQHKPKPAGSVTLAELDAMSMRPEPPAT